MRLVMFLLLCPDTSRAYRGCHYTAETIEAIASRPLIKRAKERVEMNKTRCEQEVTTKRSKRAKILARIKRREKDNRYLVKAASHNICTSLEAGRRDTLAEAYEKEGLVIVGVQEVGTTSKHALTVRSCDIYTSGYPADHKLKGHLGVEIWVGPRFKRGSEKSKRSARGSSG